MAKEVKDLLLERVSNGRFYKQDKYGLVIITTEDKMRTDYQSFPIGWIKKIEYMKEHNGTS